jgi:PAS domain S-box-containing protein
MQDTSPWSRAAVLPTQETPGAEADLEVQAAYRAIVEKAPDAVVVTDRDGRIRLVNRQTELLFGYAREELVGQPVEVLIPARLHAVHERHRAEYAAAPRVRPIGAALQLFGRRRDGSEVPIEVSLSPLTDEGGDGVCAGAAIASIRDVSELRRVEAARAAAEAANQELRQMQALTDTALSHLELNDLVQELLSRIPVVLGVDADAILLLDDDGQQLTIRAARGLEEAVAANVQVSIGRGFVGRIAASRAPLVVDDLSTFTVVHPRLFERLQSAAGVPLLVDDRLIGVLYVGSATARHFTEQEVGLLQLVADRVAVAIDRARLFKAEQTAHREAERERVRWQAAMDSTSEFVMTCDADLRRTYVNPAYARLRGGPADPSVPMEELPARHGLYLPNGTDLFPAEQLPLTRAVQEGRPVHDVEMVLYAPDGEPRLVVWEAAPMRSAEGELVGGVSIGRDITERKQAEEALRASEERYRAVVETQTEMITRYLPDTTLTFVNEAECRMMGLSREELLGTRFMDLLPDAAREPVRATIQSLLAQPGVLTVEHQARLTDGSLRWQQWVNRTILDQDGQVVELQGIGRDITERKQAEEALRASEMRFRTAFESPATGMLLTDPTGHPLEVNRPFAEMLGYSEAELRAKTFAEFTYPEDVEPNLTLFRQALAGEIDRYQVEKRYLHKEGHLIWVFLSAGVVRGPAGQPLYLVVQVQDITEHKRLEHEREAARASELALREVNRHMEQFLATASHDLRTPVTGVVMGIALAQRRLQQLAAPFPPSPPLPVGDRPADQPDAFRATLNALERASGAAQHLSRLIVQLFDVAQARTGTLELKLATCDLAALVHAEVAAQRALAPERIIRLDLDANLSVPVVADGDRLGQVLANYLTNALKYSPEDQPVVVTLKVQAGQGRVVVRDAGPGLPPEEQARVWELFHRAPGVTPQGSWGGSMGLGLYISKQIIERHGGQVGVESAPGCGSTFWFTLPLETAAAEEAVTITPMS